MTFSTIVLLPELTFPVLLLIAAFILLLIGLLGKVKIKDFDLGTESKAIRVVTSCLGIALLLLAFLVYQSDKPAPSTNSNSAKVDTRRGPVINRSTTPTPVEFQTPVLPKPDTLIEIILREQRNNVRESYGKLKGQNFSDLDLGEFIKAKTVELITERLKTEGEFLDLVLAIKRMEATERQKLSFRAANTFKRTWDQRGRVDKEGQTDAGQKAERMIAEGIVELVKELSRLSDDEIKKLQRT
jgi:hypothetical protein